MELHRHRAHRIEGVIEGPLAWVPRALVRHTLHWVLETRHSRWGYGYPRERRQRRGDRHEGGSRRLGPLPIGVCRGGGQSHERGRPDPGELQLGQGLMVVVVFGRCLPTRRGLPQQGNLEAAWIPLRAGARYFRARSCSTPWSPV